MLDIEDIPNQKQSMVTLILANQNLTRIPNHLPMKTKLLEHLDISNNKISKLPKYIHAWQSLTSFIAGNIFGGNLLSEFPNTSSFPNLRVLDLSHNFLTNIVIDSYVYIVNLQFNNLKHISVIGRVHTLNLQENQFTHLPNINADVIDISGNPLLCIPYELTNKHLICRSLKHPVSAPKDRIVQFTLKEQCQRQLNMPSGITCNVCQLMIHEYHSVYVKHITLPVEYKCCSLECISKIKPSVD
eukprot:NODE_321_length_11054_cov_0.461524.p5 type:complete len:243 gc:universal NODE_321_length_11054_cov_0.461524:7469-6741(-)